MGIWNKSDLDGTHFDGAIIEKCFQGGPSQNVTNALVNLADGTLYGAYTT